MSNEEIIQKIKLYRECQDEKVKKQLREELILVNRKLVLKIVKYFAEKYNIAEEELMDYGYEGLMVALDEFDYKSVQNAKTALAQKICSYVKKGAMNFKLSLGSTDFIWLNRHKIFEAMQKVEKDALIYPSDGEIYVDAVYNYYIEHNPGKYSYDGLKYIIRKLMPAISFDYKNGKQITKNVTEFDSVEQEFEEIYNEQRENFLEKLMKENLTQREIEIVKLCMGKIDDKAYSYTEIASMYGLSRERIRQILNKALRKLNKAKCIREVVNFDAEIAHSHTY